MMNTSQPALSFAAVPGKASVRVSMTVGDLTLSGQIRTTDIAEIAAGMLRTARDAYLGSGAAIPEEMKIPTDKDSAVPTGLGLSQGQTPASVVLLFGFADTTLAFEFAKSDCMDLCQSLTTLQAQGRAH